MAVSDVNRRKLQRAVAEEMFEACQADSSYLWDTVVAFLDGWAHEELQEELEWFFGEGTELLSDGRTARIPGGGEVKVW